MPIEAHDQKANPQTWWDRSPWEELKVRWAEHAKTQGDLHALRMCGEHVTAVEATDAELWGRALTRFLDELSNPGNYDHEDVSR